MAECLCCCSWLCVLSFCGACLSRFKSCPDLVYLCYDEKCMGIMDGVGVCVVEPEYDDWGMREMKLWECLCCEVCVCVCVCT